MTAVKEGVELVVSDDPAQHAADPICSVAAAGGNIALSGGSTPKLAYQLASNGDLDNGSFWLVDERCVAENDERSNLKLVRDTLAPLTLHPVDTTLAPELAAAAYGNLIEQELGEEPVFDLILLGVGSDGHTASLFPGTPALRDSNTTSWVAKPGLEPYVPRVTMSFKTINAAKQVAFLITGHDKAEIVRRIFGQSAEYDLPAANVAPKSGSLKLIVDAQATEEL